METRFLFAELRATIDCFAASRPHLTAAVIKKFCTCCPNLARFSGTGFELQILPNLVNPSFSIITSKPQTLNPPSHHQNPGIPAMITEPLNSHRLFLHDSCTSIAIFPHKSTSLLREFHDFLLPHPALKIPVPILQWKSSCTAPDLVIHSFLRLTCASHPAWAPPACVGFFFVIKISKLF